MFLSPVSHVRYCSSYLCSMFPEVSVIKIYHFEERLVSSFPCSDALWQNTGPKNSYLCALSPRFCFPFFVYSPFYPAAMDTAARILALSRRDSAGSPRGRCWTMRPSIICSGSGPITITPWTSQTPQDWVGEKGFSGVWEVSGPEPEPARRSRLP